MANQALGITHVFPNASIFESGDALGTASFDGVILKTADLEGLAHATAVNNFSVAYTDVSGSAPTYNGNCEKFIFGLLSTYVTKLTAVKADYATDQAKATASQEGTSQEPSAITTGGFGTLTASGGSLKKTITLTLNYATPTLDLLDEDD